MQVYRGTIGAIRYRPGDDHVIIVTNEGRRVAFAPLGLIERLENGENDAETVDLLIARRLLRIPA